MFFSLLFLLFTLVAQIRSQSVILDSVQGNFTLAALNLTLPNANTTGAPLVLGADGATSGLSFHVTSTYASYPYNDFPAIALINNTLQAAWTSGEWTTNATEVQSGGKLGWVTTIMYAAPAPKIYTLVRVPAYKYLVLAAHGVFNSWSLCPSSGFRGQTSVVFNVTAANPPPQGCYPVVIQAIPNDPQNVELSEDLAEIAALCDDN